MKNYKFPRFSSIILLILALLWTLGHNPLGPIFLALYMLFITFDVFKNRLNRTAYSIIMAAILAGMILGEYFWVHLQTAIFYVPLLTLSVGLWVSFYVSLTPKDQFTQRVKNLSRIGIILFMVSIPAFMILIYNNFIITLIICMLLLIVVLIGLLMRRKISKDDAYNTRSPEEYWFRIKIGGGLPKPARWQGWAWYAIIFLSLFVVLIFDRDPTTAIIIVVASIFIGMTIAMLKSNYRESIREYRENLRKKYDNDI